MARPSDYSPEVADAICEALADGKSLREVCRADGMPSIATVMRWLDAHSEFREQYARAKEFGIEALAEDILDISDNGSNDWMERNDRENKGYEVNGEAIQRSKLRVESRKWLLTKLAPKKYGDKVQQQHTGANGGPIESKGTLTVEFVRANPDP